MALTAPETADVIVDGARSMAVMRNVRKLADPDEVRKMVAFAKGFMLRGNLDDGFRVRPILGKTWKSYKTIEGVEDFIVKQLGKIADYSEQAARMAGASGHQGRVQTVLRGVLKEGAEKDIRILSRMIAPVGGEFKSSNVKAFSQAYLKARGVSDDVYRSLKTFEQGGHRSGDSEEPSCEYT